MMFVRLTMLGLIFVLGSAQAAPGKSRTAPAASIPWSVAAANRGLVEKCRRSVPLGTSVLVQRAVKSLCIAPAGYTQAKPDFTLSNQLDGIHLGYKLVLKMEGFEPAEVEENLAGMQGCVAQIQSFWQRYDIKFDLAIGAARADEAHQSVVLSNSACRADDRKICLAGRFPDAPRCEDGCRSELTRAACLAGCKAAHWNRVCLLMLHETGHHLGLPDEYADPVCVDRPFISRDEKPWSVMDSQEYGWEQIDFFPRHLKTILGDLCPATECH